MSLSCGLGLPGYKVLDPLSLRLGRCCRVPPQGAPPFQAVGVMVMRAVSSLPGSGPGTTGLTPCACCTRGRCCTTASIRTKRGSSPSLAGRISTHYGRYTSSSEKRGTGPWTLLEYATWVLAKTCPIRVCFSAFRFLDDCSRVIMSGDRGSHSLSRAP